MAEVRHRKLPEHLEKPKGIPVGVNSHKEYKTLCFNSIEELNKTASSLIGGLAFIRKENDNA